jgi:hypothetical protein
MEDRELNMLNDPTYDNVDCMQVEAAEGNKFCVTPTSGQMVKFRVESSDEAQHWVGRLSEAAKNMASPKMQGAPGAQVRFYAVTLCCVTNSDSA